MSDDPGAAPALIVYSRRGCHLCEQLVEELLPLVRDAVPVTVLDIDSREDWRRQYGARIPVVVYRGRELCEYHLDAEAVRAALAESTVTPGTAVNP